MPNNPATKMKLTEHLILTFKRKEKNYNIWDTVEKTLCVSVSKHDRVYVFYKKLKGRQLKRIIGSTKDIKLKQARLKASHFLKSFDDNYLERNTSPKFCDFLVEYEEKIACKWADTTIPVYNSHKKLRLIPTFKRFRLNQIQKKHIYEWFIKSSVEGKKGASNRALEILKSMFNTAIEWGYMEINPTLGIKINPKRKMINYLTYRDIKKLGLYLNKDLKRMYHDQTIEESPFKQDLILRHIRSIHIIKILLITGCRLNEIQSLKWEYIKSDYIHLPHTKTGARDVFINTNLREILNDLKKMQTSPTGYIFDNPNNKCNYHTTTGSYWRLIRKDLGFNTIRLHDLRHTFASLSIQDGFNILTVSKMLGHKSLATTARYIHTADKTIVSDNQMISDVIDKLL